MTLLSDILWSFVFGIHRKMPKRSRICDRRSKTNKMKIMRENRELVKAFMRILMERHISDECIEMIVSMLADIPQMDELVRYIQSNPKATEMEVLDKAAEISGLLRT